MSKIFQAHRILGFILAMLITAIVLPGYAQAATGSFKIVQEDTAVNEYSIQQLFSAEVHDGAMSEPNFGNGVSEGFWTEVAKMEGYPTGQVNPQVIAEWIASNASGENYRSFVVSLATQARAFKGEVSSVKTGEETQLESGYYIVSSDTAEPFVAYVEAGKPTTVNEKSTTPAVSKQVLDEVGNEVGIKEASIGDPLTFRITGTLPTNYNSFPSYYYEIIDIPDGSFDFDLGAIKVKLASKDGSDKDITDSFKVVEDSNSGNVSLICADLKQVLPSDDGSSKVIADYKASLNDQAQVGLSTPNANKASLKYYPNPTSQEWGVADENIINPQATIFTYKTVINKVSTEDPSKMLPGAGFAIMAEDGTYFNGSKWTSEQYVFRTGEDGKVEIKGLSSGEYKIVEVQAPDGYEKQEQAVPLTIDVSIEKDGTDVTLDTASGNADILKVNKSDAKEGIIDLTFYDKPLQGAAFPGSISEVVKTGDAFPILAVAGLFIIAAIAALAIRSRKNGTAR